MSQLGTVYATKRRRRNGKSLKPPPKDGVTKSNPSKRHRERLNAELDLLASLLPFEQNILSKLDRLSILRLSVSYLRTKSYFQYVMHKDKEENGGIPHIHSHDTYRTRELGAFEHGLLDGDMFLQALNGFLMILTCEGEVFFATHSIESYLGFHQSDIVHQSVYELVHSEDREELQRQLLWNSFLPADMSTIQLAETLAPDKTLYLERSFTVRFRCLLDNTSGFLRLDIRGRIKVLHGQNRKTEEPPLALFAYCTPFGPPSLLEIPHKENMFKSKHKLDLSLVSMDQRGKHILGYSDGELANMGGYDLVHYDDLAYVASAHQELLKTGASGMIAYRYQKKDGEWQWLQTSSRLVYKNSKPDFVICTHRQLMDEEGHDLLGKRTMDFKVSYLDTGLASTYFSESDQLVAPPCGSPNALPPPVTPSRPNRRYKTQLRDFLSTCRTKRKMQQQTQQNSPLSQVASPSPVVEYLPDPAAAVAAAYSNLNPMYTASPYATAADNIYMGTSVHSTNFYPVTENLFHQYRLQGVGGYYTDYHHTAAPASAYVANGFLSYDGYAIASKDDKWQDTGKYYSGYSSGYGSPTSTPQQISLKTPKSSPHIMEVVSCSSDGPSPTAVAQHGVPGSNSTTPSSVPTSITPKIEGTPQEQYERQTVLMWGTQSSGVPLNTINPNSRHNNAIATTAAADERSPQNTPLTNGVNYNNNNNNENETVSAKWNGSKDSKSSSATATTPESYQQLQQHDDSGLYSTSSLATSPQQHSSRLPGSTVTTDPGSNTSGAPTAQHQQHNRQQQQEGLLHGTNHTPAHNLHHTANSNAVLAPATTAAAHPHNHHHHHTHPHTPHSHSHHVHPHHPHHHHHHHHAHQHAHHTTAPSPAATAAVATTNGTELNVGQQQQQQQQQHHQLQQLGYSGQLQSLPGCTSTASSSSSPSCTSPLSSSLHNGSTSVGLSTATSAAATLELNGAQQMAQYHHHHHHQLAIIASPIVLTSSTSAATNVNGQQQQQLDHELAMGTVATATYHRIPPAGSVAPATAVRPRKYSSKSSAAVSTAAAAALHNQTLLYGNGSTSTLANITAHTALAYAPANAYVISGMGGSVGLNGVFNTEQHTADGSPLLSFSEVTNTLLNQ